jgi:hypothetical protein
VAKQLLMLQSRTKAVTEPDAMLEYTIHMDNHHAAISKCHPLDMNHLSLSDQVRKHSPSHTMEGSFFPLLGAIEGMLSMV